MSTLTASQKEKLMNDLRVVVADAEELLKLTAGEVSENAAGLRERLQERMLDAKHSLLDLQATVSAKAREAGHAADDYVHENPWQSVGVGVAIGLVFGLLIGRR